MKLPIMSVGLSPSLCNNTLMYIIYIERVIHSSRRNKEGRTAGPLNGDRLNRSNMICKRRKRRNRPIGLKYVRKREERQDTLLKKQNHGLHLLCLYTPFLNWDESSGSGSVLNNAQTASVVYMQNQSKLDIEFDSQLRTCGVDNPFRQQLRTNHTITLTIRHRKYAIHRVNEGGWSDTGRRGKRFCVVLNNLIVFWSWKQDILVSNKWMKKGHERAQWM